MHVTILVSELESASPSNIGEGCMSKEKGLGDGERGVNGSGYEGTPTGAENTSSSGPSSTSASSSVIDALGKAATQGS
jgi:hypothetical protein